LKIDYLQPIVVSNKLKMVAESSSLFGRSVCFVTLTCVLHSIGGLIRGYGACINYYHTVKFFLQSLEPKCRPNILLIISLFFFNNVIIKAGIIELSSYK